MGNAIKSKPSKFQELFDTEIAKREEQIARLKASMSVLMSSIAANENKVYAEMRPRCPMCGTIEVNTTWEDQHVPYGVDTPLVLVVRVPVHNCVKCNESFTNWEGEELRDKATEPLRKAGIK